MAYRDKGKERRAARKYRIKNLDKFRIWHRAYYMRHRSICLRRNAERLQKNMQDPLYRKKRALRNAIYHKRWYAHRSEEVRLREKTRDYKKYHGSLAIYNIKKALHTNNSQLLSQALKEYRHGLNVHVT